MKKTGLLLSVVLGLTAMCGCGSSEASVSAEGETRTITDGADRQVAIPEKVDSIVCSGVGALRYTCYMQAQDLVIGVEDYEQGKDISRGYSIVNGEQFAKLPVIGANGDPYAEEIITAAPDGDRSVLCCWLWRFLQYISCFTAGISMPFLPEWRRRPALVSLCGG